MRTWPLTDAKAHLSELVRLAQEDGPQEITVHNRPAVVVLSLEAYRQAIQTEPEQSFVAFMRSSPWAGVELDLERNQDASERELNL